MRRTILLLAAMALTLSVASGVALAVPTTFSNSSSISIVDATSAATSPANPYPSDITVQGLSGTISDVNLKLNGYSHGFPDDVAVQLVGPDRTSVLLMSDVGGAAPFGSTAVNDINLTLDDEAANSLYDNGYLTTGTYKPTEGTTPDCNPWVDYRCSEWVDYHVPNIWPPDAPDLAASARQLSAFDGKAPNGTWKLYVIDDTPFESGQFAGGWSLEINNTTVTTPLETSITSGPAEGSSTTSSSPTFGFSSTKQGSTFQCQLNKDGAVAQAFAACTSPKSYSTLTPGNYKFEVKATNSGIVDQTPASRTWTITSPPVEPTAPTVTATVPAPGALDVARGVNVKATFSEDMMASSINGQTFKLFKKGTTTKIAATVTYDPTTRTATLNPFESSTTLLARGTTYKAVVTTGAKDVAGNQLDQSPTTGLQQKAWLFTVKP